MKLKLIFILLPFYLLSTPPQDSISRTDAKIDALKKEIEHLKENIIKHENHYKDLIDGGSKEYQLKHDKIVNKVDIYLAVVGGVFAGGLAFLGFWFNFFGRTTIKNFIDRETQKVIDKEVSDRLNRRLTDEWLKNQVEEKAQIPIESAVKRLQENFKSLSEKLLDGEREKMKTHNQNAKVLLRELSEKRKELDDISNKLSMEKQSPENKKKVEEYNEALKEVKSEENYNSDDWLWKGNALYDDELYLEAIEAYTKAIDLDDSNFNAYNNRGVSKGILSPNLDAIEDINHAINLNPNNPEFLANRANVFVELNEFKKALNDLDKAIEKDPKNPTFFNNRGYVKNTLENYLSAIEDLDIAIQLEESKNPYAHRAYSYLMLEDLEKAIMDNQMAFKLDKEYDRAFYNLGFIKLKQGNSSEACKSWKKALELGFKKAQEKLDEYCT